MKRFTTEGIPEILSWIVSRFDEVEQGEYIEFLILDPDNRYTEDNNSNDRYHSWRVWNDVSLLTSSRMMTPRLTQSGDVLMRLQRLDSSNSFHTTKVDDPKEKYGVDSHFATLDKNQEPAFYYYYKEALENVKLEHRRDILNLGINSASEFRLIRAMLPHHIYQQINFTGVDYSTSAIEKAKLDFPESNVSLHCHDINHLDQLKLKRSDLIISIGTLQSPNINFKSLFMSLIQEYLTQNGAVILGFPNCRWIDIEMIYGAKAPNYRFPEMSLVIKDIYFCKKYLQQHKFRVTITGKEYIFLTATKIV